MFRVLVVLLFSFISLFGFEHLNSTNFEKKIKGKNVIVDFYATWCPPCKILSKSLIGFDKVKPSDVEIFKVDIDQYMDLAQKYNIRALPTLVYFKNGKMLAKEVGIKDIPQLTNSSERYFK